MSDAPTEPDAGTPAAATSTRPELDGAAIRDLVIRLARPTRTGGHVIERAAILAEGSRCGDIEAWIVHHGGEPEMPPVRVGRGLHADRGDRPGGAPTRYLLPAGALA